MRKVISIVFVMMAMLVYGQSEPEITPEEWEACERIAKNVQAPYYFCDCSLTSIHAEFPIELTVSDTMWFSTSLSDMEQGISAYWFSESDVTMEVYAFCTSKIPTISFDVPANRMYEMSEEQINKRLSSMGTTALTLAGSLEPMVRVYPHDGGSGRVYAYPYNQGPTSMCESSLPFVPRMRYICDSTQRVFRMEPDVIPDTTRSFLRWYHWNNRDCEIRLTLDSCNGELLDSTTLKDTLHVYWLDTAKLAKIKKEGRVVWVHARAEKNAIGRLTWYEDALYTEPDTLNDTTCLGKKLNANMIEYLSDTSFVDTIVARFDTLRLRTVNLTFTRPELEYDTVYVDPSAIRRGYRYKPSGDIFYEFGEYEVEVKKNNTCTRAILLNILNSKEQGVEETEATRRKAKKILRDGQLLIEIENEIFDVFGQKIINN